MENVTKNVFKAKKGRVTKAGSSLFAILCVFHLFKNLPRTGILIGLSVRVPLTTPTKSGFHWITSVGVISGIGRKWNRSDSSDPDSVELMTPLTTLIFDFH